MAICIRSVYIIIIVFPVFSTSIIWRIDVNTIHFTCIQIFQKLQCMIIIRLNQGMPKITIWCIAYTVQWFQIWINWFSKLSYTYQIADWNHFLFFCDLVRTNRHSILYSKYFIHSADRTSLLSYTGASLYRHIIKRCTFWKMLLKH